MRIAFFVNDIATEYEGYTTTVLAHQAAKRGHEVMYITPSDFLIDKDDSLRAHVRRMPMKKWTSRESFFKALKDSETEADAVSFDEVDVLWLRSDPSLDSSTATWRAEAGILFGREATKRGTLVLNDPHILGQAINKLYFQSFPEEARAETIITRDERDIKAFAKEHKNNIILKPLQGSGGSGVFKLDKENARNLNQMTEAISRDGYIICQAYIPAAKNGDVRLFLMNGSPLQVDGKYAALRRVAAKDDIRSNIHAGGKAEAVEIGKTELRIAEIIRPKLIADGMFLVGVDIVGDKI
ncbi:MAG TPA: YheC/YheD family protein, partial [Sphingomicrobium sp.]|nr:YheC/YheD family protein [Sphingomicrobium sp.]